jgi:hypothetical protein
LLDWLASAERSLRYQGNLPEDEANLARQLDEHKKFMTELGDQNSKLEECLEMGDLILRKCHPDATTTVKHWLTILKSRWDEVGDFQALGESIKQKKRSSLIKIVCRYKFRIADINLKNALYNLANYRII